MMGSHSLWHFKYFSHSKIKPSSVPTSVTWQTWQRQTNRDLKTAWHRGQRLISSYRVSEMCFRLHSVGEQPVTAPTHWISQEKSCTQAGSSYLSFFTLPVTAVWYSTPRPWGGCGAQGEWRGRGEVSDLRSGRGRWRGGTAGRQPSGESHGRVAGRRQTVSVVQRLWCCGVFGLTPCRAAVWGRQRRWRAWGLKLGRAERPGS